MRWTGTSTSSPSSASSTAGWAVTSSASASSLYTQSPCSRCTPGGRILDDRMTTSSLTGSTCLSTPRTGRSVTHHLHPGLNFPRSLQISLEMTTGDLLDGFPQASLSLTPQTHVGLNTSTISDVSNIMFQHSVMMSMTHRCLSCPRTRAGPSPWGGRA